MKKKRIIPIIVIAFSLGVALLSCSKDDPAVNPTDDGGGPIDDGGGPVGFVGEIDWLKALGGSGIDEGVDIIRTSDNAYIVVGNTSSNDGDIIDKTTTDQDFWVLKIAENGDIIWNKTFGGSNNDTARSITSTPDGGYLVVGGTRSNDGDVTSGNAGFIDFWILKLDASGNKVWDKTYGFSGEDRANDVIQTKDGGFLVTGFFDVTASGGQGNDGREYGNRNHAGGEFWAIKINPNGEYTWRRFFGGFNDDRSYQALELSSGGFLLLGTSESPDGDVTDNKGQYDFWVVRINDLGNLLWARSYGGAEIDTGYSGLIAPDGNVLFVGDSRSEDQDVTDHIGNADLWVVKFALNGNLIWSKSLGGSQFESARSIQSMNDGNYLLAGSTRSSDGDVSSNKGQNDAWVVFMDGSGELVFEKTIGGTSFDFAEHAITGNLPDTVLMVGSTESGDIDIPGNNGLKDLLLVKLK
ncbi:MAG: hypothetical protein HKO54_08665 [Flavobacteriaceae bacterium]|nr:hypothetical protein [Flavobacteriaceae bacterium]